MPDEQGNLLPGDEGHVPVETGIDTPPAQQDAPDTETDNPQAMINNPETAHQPNPGEGNPPELHPITNEDFVAHPESGIDANMMQEKAEQTVDKAGRPAGFNEFYAGSHMVNPDNENLYHIPSGDFELNANKENR